MSVITKSSRTNRFDEKNRDTTRFKKFKVTERKRIKVSKPGIGEKPCIIGHSGCISEKIDFKNISSEVKRKSITVKVKD